MKSLAKLKALAESIDRWWDFQGFEGSYEQWTRYTFPPSTARTLIEALEISNAALEKLTEDACELPYEGTYPNIAKQAQDKIQRLLEGI